MTSASIPFLSWLLLAAAFAWTLHFLVTRGQRQYRKVPWPGTICARCRCGADFHTHHRRGSDCGICGVARCWEYVASSADPLYDQAVDEELRDMLDGAA